MTPKLYSSVRSPHCLKVAIFLQEKGIPFERIEVDLPNKQQRTPAYLRVNPLGLVPAYVDDNGPHADSLLIMHYLEWQHPAPRLFPEDTDLVEALGWIERSSTEFRDVSHHLYWQLIEPPASGPDQARIDALMGQGHALLQELETQLSDRDYICGIFGVVDIAMIPWVYGYNRFEGLLDPAAFPNVVAWTERVSSRPSFRDNYQAVGIPFESEP